SGRSIEPHLLEAEVRHALLAPPRLDEAAGQARGGAPARALADAAPVAAGTLQALGARAHESAGAADRGAGATARRAAADGPAPGRPTADDAADRPHRRHRAERRPRPLEPSRPGLPPRAAE